VNKFGNEWTRIPDGTPYLKEPVESRFLSPSGYYNVALFPERPADLYVSSEAEDSRWAIDVVETAGDALRVAGMAWRHEGVLDDAFWFEFEIGNTASITFWGNQVVHRRDEQA